MGLVIQKRHIAYYIACLLVALVIFLLVSCGDTILTTGPTTASTGGATTTEEEEAPMAGTIKLEPASINVGIGENVFVRVTVQDANGVEEKTVDLTVSILNDSVIRLVGVDHRTIEFLTRATGKTEVLIRASGLQTSLPVLIE